MNFIKLLFSPKGIITRKEWWISFLFSILIFPSLFNLLKSTGILNNLQQFVDIFDVALSFWIFTVACIKRARDRGVMKLFIYSYSVLIFSFILFILSAFLIFEPRLFLLIFLVISGITTIYYIYAFGIRK